MTNSGWTLSDSAPPRLDLRKAAVLLTVGFVSWGALTGLCGAAMAAFS